jgi:DNA-binding NtrC family response regulator
VTNLHRAGPARPDPPLARVLVVDDEAGVRALLVRWLHELGCAVTQAATAEEGAGQFDRDPVDVVLCDIALPDHDGHWLVARVRARDRAAGIVMITGRRDVGPALTSLQHGFADFLVKPFSRDRLREAVQKGLAWQSRARAGDGAAGHLTRRAPG